MIKTYYQCDTHGRLEWAIERRGDKPKCPLCGKPVVLRVKSHR